ncbi:hypothetical protein [Methylorubrum sp. SB2]|uniref:hypothetical protein n=1 Tax=Methylorubrum subtropicum TaxID=3138812 RepID=UPI00313AA3A9
MLKWLALAGCCLATPVLAETASIRTTKDEASLSKCERLGDVDGTSLLAGLMQNVGYNRAVDEMKDKTAELGGTHLLIFDVSTSKFGASAHGVAFRCGAKSSARRR